MLKTRSTLVVFSLVIVLSLLVTTGAWAQEVQNPDTFVVGHFGEPETLDPAWMYDTSSAAVASNVYEGLLAFERDDAEAFCPRPCQDVGGFQQWPDLVVRYPGWCYVP